MSKRLTRTNAFGRRSIAESTGALSTLLCESQLMRTSTRRSGRTQSSGGRRAGPTPRTERLPPASTRRQRRSMLLLETARRSSVVLDSARYGCIARIMVECVGHASRRRAATASGRTTWSPDMSKRLTRTRALGRALIVGRRSITDSTGALSTPLRMMNMGCGGRVRRSIG